MTEPQWLINMREAARNGDPQYKGIAFVETTKLLERNPDLLKIFQEKIGKTVKHDEHTKNLVLFTGLSAYNTDYTTKFTPLNTFLKGESSSGKTHNATETIKLFPKEDVWLLGGISPKALIRQHGVLLDKDDKPITFSERPSGRRPYRPKRRRGESKDDFEIRFHHYEEEIAAWETERLEWEEKMKNAKYLIDLSGKILVFLEAPQEETFHLLLPILSHDAKEISFPYVDTKSGIKTINVVVRGWCATIFCTTKIEYLEELSTRSFTASPSVTKEKTKAGINLAGSMAAHPNKFEETEEDEILRGYLFTLGQMQFGRKRLDVKQGEGSHIKIINPLGEKFAECFFPSAVRAMRDIQHIFALMNVSAMFHYAQRPFVQVGEGFDRVDYIMVTMKDFENVAAFLPEIGRTTVSGLSQEVLDIHENVCIPLSNENGEEGFSRTDAVEKHNKVFPHHRRSYTFITATLKELEKRSYLTSFKHKDDKKTIYYRVINNPENPFKISLRDFLDSFSEKDLEKWLEILRGDFAGKQISIRKQIFDSDTTIDSVSDLYKKFYLADPSLRKKLAQENSTAIKEENDLTRFVDSPKDNASLSDENKAKSENFVDRFKIVYGHWIDFAVQERGICWTCGKSAIMKAEIDTADNKKHRVCETCAEQIMRELNKSTEVCA